MQNGAYFGDFLLLYNNMIIGISTGYSASASPREHLIMPTLFLSQ